MTDLATLRALLAAATPLPWTVERKPIGTCIRDQEGDGNYIQFSTFVEPLGLQTFGPWRNDLTSREKDGPDSDYVSGNAALIAAAVNALPALIAVAEAGERYRDEIVSESGERDIWARYVEFRDALAALAKVTP